VHDGGDPAATATRSASTPSIRAGLPLAGSRCYGPPVRTKARSAAGILFAFACTPTGPDKHEDLPPRAVVASSAAPLEPVAFDGDCASGPPMGSLDAYAGASATLISASTGVRARSCAVWPAEDLRNVLGVLAAGQRVPVFGPVKHPLFSAGIGYVVPLVDARGERCRGYVSHTALERVDRHPRSGAADPLPDARPAWTGPCLLDR
jgi:hypothetical protein